MRYALAALVALLTLAPVRPVAPRVEPDDPPVVTLPKEVQTDARFCVEYDYSETICTNVRTIRNFVAQLRRVALEEREK